MQRPSRLLLTLVLTALVLSGAPHLVARAAPELPSIGTAVSFPLGDGSGTATITVTQVVDPFGALGGGTPAAGMRYVYVELTVANGGKAPLEIDTVRATTTELGWTAPALTYPVAARSRRVAAKQTRR